MASFSSFAPPATTTTGRSRKEGLSRGPPGMAMLYDKHHHFETPYATVAESRGVSVNDGAARFASSNPRVIRSVTREEMARMPPCAVTGRTTPYYLADDGEGRACIIAPLNSSRALHTEPQCSTCLKTVWQCDRFRGSGQRNKYEQCKEFEKCFLYDTVREDGTLIPLSVRVTPECMAASQAAIRKCAARCGHCQPCDRASSAAHPPTSHPPTSHPSSTTRLH